MKMIKISAALILVWLVSACTNTTVRQHIDHQSLAKDIASVAIIPPDVKINLITFDGDNEELIEEQLAMEKEIISIAKSRFEAEGLEVIEFDIASAVAEDEDFAYAVTQCVEAWNATKEELYSTGVVSESKKSTFNSSLGPVANGIAERTGADAVFLMDYQGAKKSKGMIAKDAGTSILIGVLTAGAVVPVQATQSATVDMALIDANSGKIIWNNRKFIGVVDSGIVQQALTELPDVTWKSELPSDEAAAEVDEPTKDLDAVKTSPAQEDGSES
jgi:hypothetical protein